jgi:hypothetical protein
MSTSEQNKQIVMAYTTGVLGDKNLAVVDQYVADNYSMTHTLVTASWR